MDLLNNNNTQNKQNEVTEVWDKTQSANLTEFLSAEELDDWPLLEGFEIPPNSKLDGLLAGTPDDISAILDKAASVKLPLLEAIENRLSDLEVRLNVYANQIVTDDKMQLCSKGFVLPSFRTELLESDAIKRISSSGEHKSVILADMLFEMKEKTLNYFKFPGFKHGEFIELPSKLEPLQILHHISTVQNFNPGLRKIWKKIFLSEASSTVLQDSFWWIFLDKFNNEAGFKDDKEFLFDRIAASYTALFMSINSDVKDKFLSIYPNCLSQALYCTYKESFPESKGTFDEEFKHYLVNLIYEWITGIHPVFGVWKTWNEEILKRAKTSKHCESTMKVLEAATVHKKMELSLDVDACTKVIDKLGTGARELSQIDNSQENTGTSRVKSHHSKTESHQVGPGPEFEMVKFNISGRSPLIAHYLYMLQLRSDIQPGVKVKRTEIVKLPPESQTYQQLITSTLEMKDSLRKDYTRICEQTSADILDLKKMQIDKNKEINKLKKALRNARNAHERSVAIDAIMEYKESELRGTSLTDDHPPDPANNSSSDCDDDETESQSSLGTM